jgi:hypothetical protein
VLLGKSEGKSQFVRPRFIWNDITKMGLQEFGWEGVYWIDLAQDREMWRAVVNAVMSLRVP